MALALSACAGPPATTQDVEVAYLVHRLHVHPATGLSDWLRDVADGEVSTLIETLFEGFACYGDAFLVPRLDVELGAGGGFGRMDLLIGTSASAGNPCDGEVDVLVQSSSYVDPSARPRVAQVKGPLFIEGRTMDARINLGDFEVAGASLVVFPRWWDITADLEGFDPATGELLDDGLRLTDAQAAAVWTVAHLGDTMVEGSQAPALAELAAGLQPDVDVDGDGLERVMSDGVEILACRDGDGTVIEGPRCYRDPRIADGYDLRLVFRLVPVPELIVR